MVVNTLTGFIQIDEAILWIGPQLKGYQQKEDHAFFKGPLNI